MMKRSLSTPAILLLALSLGMWLGASWHTASQASLSGKCCVTCLDGSSLLASIQNRGKPTKISESKPAVASTACAFCVAGAMVQDTPSCATHSPIPAIPTATPSSPHLLTVTEAHNFSQPPQRGPPLA